jgi:two-component sensor histidine kinase
LPSRAAGCRGRGVGGCHEAGTLVNLENLYRFLRGAPDQARDIVDTLPLPLLVLDRDLRVVSASRAFYATFKVEPGATLGRRLHELGGGQWDIPELRRLLEDVIPESAAVLNHEVTHDFPDLGRRTMLLTARKLVQPDASDAALLLTIEDATARHHAAEEQDLLLGELRHRVKNLLALVQALAHQTATEGRTAAAYRDDFLGRFGALVRAHDLTGFGQAGADLRGLVERTLAPYAAGPAAVVVEPGPAVALPPAQVLPLGLILHELATNAIKHGAFSAPGGRVRVGWEVEAGTSAGGGRLRLRWEERGGPPASPPAARGFGTRFIGFAATHELGGAAELSFAPEGLAAEITARLGR